MARGVVKHVMSNDIDVGMISKQLRIPSEFWLSNLLGGCIPEAFWQYFSVPSILGRR